MERLLEYLLFGLLVVANLSLGLYFSFRKVNNGTGQTTTTASEVFLGSRMLKTLPLAASSVASLVSSTGIIGFPAHFYAYGWHLSWCYVTHLVLIPLATEVFVPVLYRLQITSIFEYIRLRFDGTIALTACVIYIFVTAFLSFFAVVIVALLQENLKRQSIGAISIFAASLTLVTVFEAPLFWSNVCIGLSGTLYVVLGGLRGVVWTDCMQFVLVVLAPYAIIIKILIDSFSPGSNVQPVNDLDVAKYIGNYALDFSSDETIWSCFIGSSALTIYRLCLDQVVAQRFLASGSLKAAKRTVVTSTLLLTLLHCSAISLGVALTIWFRGCDPKLMGNIEKVDQILPYYISTYLFRVPGFVGLLLAGIVCAATSTVSSTINSQAAIVFVDIIAHRYKKAEQHVLLITRSTALILGLLMTVYSTLCVHMGSVTKLFTIMYNGLSAPFVGLCLLGLLFPFVRSKGAGVATLAVVLYQVGHIAETIRSGKPPPLMKKSLEYCSANHSATGLIRNTTFSAVQEESKQAFFLFRISYLWGSFFSIIATIALAVLVSAFTVASLRERELKMQSELCYKPAWRFWEKRKFLKESNQCVSVQCSEKELKSEAEDANLFSRSEDTFV